MSEEFKATATATATEHDLQSAFVEWFRLQFPDIKIFAIPNGGLRDKRVAKFLKKEGVLSGVPDLFIPKWNLWIEMKSSRKARLTEDQKEMINYLESIGHTCMVAHGFDEAHFQVVEFLRNKVSSPAHFFTTSPLRKVEPEPEMACC